MVIDSFIAYIKTEDIYSNILKDVEKRFDTPNHELDRPLPIGKNKKVIGLMKDELVEQIMKEFAALRAKTYKYLTKNKDADKEAKNTKKCVVIRKINFEHYQHCLEATQLENKINHLEKIILMWIIFKKIRKNP